MRSHVLPHNELVPVVREPPGSSVVARWSAAVLLAAHGAIHGMGFLLLWRLTEPGELRYTDSVPEAGSAIGFAVGLVWLLAGVLFVYGAWLLSVRAERWLPVVTAAAAVSVAPLALMAGDGRRASSPAETGDAGG
jgi:drug/metabolite transporter (DMT)-like permease